MNRYIEKLKEEFGGLIEPIMDDNTFRIRLVPMKVIYDNDAMEPDLIFGDALMPQFSLNTMLGHISHSRIKQIELYHWIGLTVGNRALTLRGQSIDTIKPFPEMEDWSTYEVITHLVTSYDDIPHNWDTWIYRDIWKVRNLVNRLQEIKDLRYVGISDAGITFKIAEKDVIDTTWEYLASNYSSFIKKIDGDIFQVKVYPMIVEYDSDFREEHILLLNQAASGSKYTLAELQGYLLNNVLNSAELYHVDMDTTNVTYALPGWGHIKDVRPYTKDFEDLWQGEYPIITQWEPYRNTNTLGLINFYSSPAFINRIFDLLKWIKENPHIKFIGRDIKQGLIYQIINDDIRKEEVEIMKGKNIAGINFEFGPVDDRLGLSVNGIAFKNNEGNYVTYNAQTNTITDVSDFTFNIEGMLWSVPVTIDQIKANDIILHKGDFVVAIADYDKEKGNSVDVVNPITQTKQTILPTQNIFGFNFITKVVNCASTVLPTGEPDAANPFGNMIPLMIFSKLMDGSTGDNGMIKMLALSSFMNNGGSDNPFAQMMPFFMIKDVLK